MIAIVTGANHGVGLETARGLARHGARVVLAVRNAEKGEAAARDVVASVPGARVEAMLVDVSDLESVRRFVAEYQARHDRLDVLVNNAGIHTAKRALSAQGHELTLATNHLGHFLLTNLLLDLLKRSAPSRVVNVASEAHAFGRIRFDDLMGERSWSGFGAYAQSKLANVMFTYALARRLEGTGVVAHAVHPGSVRTGWARGRESGLFRHVVALASPFLLTPEQGARAPLHAALSPEAARVNGRYYVRRREAQSIRASHDVAAQERLWRESARLVGLS